MTALVKREQVQKYEAEMLLEKAFGGSLPSFIAAFLKDKSLNDEAFSAGRRHLPIWILTLFPAKR